MQKQQKQLLIENWRDYIKKPDEERKCLTPGSFYDMEIKDNVVGVRVRLPMNIDISEEEAIQLENEMHDALEAILSKYF